MDISREDEEALLPTATHVVPSQSTYQRVLQVVRVIYASPPERPDIVRRETAWMDGLRGLAALGVLSFHWHSLFDFALAASYGAQTFGPTPFTYREWYRTPVFRWVYGGGTAWVCLFFIISGFVLSHGSLHLVARGEPDKMMRKLSPTVFRRCLRLWIPTVLTSFVGMLTCLTGVRDIKGPGMKLYPDSKDLTFIGATKDWMIESFFRLLPNLPTAASNLHYIRFEAVLWTIPLEYYGSCAIFLTVVLLAKIQYKWLRRGLLALLIIHPSCTLEYWFLGPFFIGMLFADFKLDVMKWPQTLVRQAGFLVLQAVILIAALFFCGVPGRAGWGNPFTAPLYQSMFDLITIVRFWETLGATLIFLSASINPGFRALLNTRFISDLILAFYQPWLVRSFAPLGTPGNYISYILFWSTSLPIMFLIASWHERIIDRNAIRFMYYLERKAAGQKKAGMTLGGSRSQSASSTATFGLSFSDSASDETLLDEVDDFSTGKEGEKLTEDSISDQEWVDQHPNLEISLPYR